MITIIFGKPGAGKTLYMVADAYLYLCYSAVSRTAYAACLKDLTFLNKSGASFEIPPYMPVYSNFPIKVRIGTIQCSSYYIDGFHMGIENPFINTYPVLPSSRIYLSEAQRYYNSRMSQYLPSWVSRFFEEHRHFGLNIMLDTQRPGLIDPNIRELAGKFVEVRETIVKNNKRTGGIQSISILVREFEDWKFVEKYIAGTNLKEVNYVEKTLNFEWNLFNCYESRSYFAQFVPCESKSFSMMLHPCVGSILEEAEISRELYPQSPPPGFYAERKAVIKA